MSAGYVYVIGEPRRSVVKIGQSTDPSRRLGQIQLTSPVRLEVLWSHPGSHLEAQLHQHFAHHRSHGEWFDFGGDDPVRAVRAAVEEQPWLRPVPPQRGAVRALPDCARCGHSAHRNRRCDVVGWDEWLDCQCATYAAVRGDRRASQPATK